jgi:hypothetical protein
VKEEEEMRNPRSLLTLLVALAALASAGFGSVLAQDATPIPGPGEGTTIVVIERAASDQVVDLAPEGDSMGDLLVFANDVYDENNETQVGTDQGWCIRTRVGVSWECTWTMTLAEGQIVVQGPFMDTGESTLAIIGGTGAYAGARGEMGLEANDETSYRFTYRLQ